MRSLENQTAVSDDGIDSTTHAYNQVRRAVLDGTLPPSSVFSQVQVAKQLGISRTPLREALRLLQTEGLVTSEVRRRVRVSALDLDDLEELYAMRLTLEPMCVRFTVPRLTDIDLDAIQDAMDRYHAWIRDPSARTADPDAGRTAHREFHLGLAGRAGPRLGRTVSELWDHAERYRLLYHDPVSVDAVVVSIAEREHEGILAAARERDGERCASLVADHLARTALTVIAGQDPRREPQLVRDALRHATCEDKP